jgi:hypothetical protein
MHRKTAQKILDDDDTINIEMLAAAHAEEQKRQRKSKKAPSIQRSLSAWDKLKARNQAEEGWRQKVAKVWNKKKSP